MHSTLAAYVTSCDFLQKMVAASAPIEGFKSSCNKLKDAFNLRLAKIVHKVKGL